MRNKVETPRIYSMPNLMSGLSHSVSGVKYLGKVLHLILCVKMPMSETNFQFFC